MKAQLNPIVCVTLLLNGIQVQAQTPPPNLVFIMADQWRGDALGCLNITPVSTPYLDNLAAQGVLFSDAISSYPVSSPARGMLMTGMYPVQSKVTGNCNSSNAPYGVELETSARCWSDVLKDKGYALGYIGKWHLDSPYEPYVNTSNNKGKVAWNEWCPKERRHGFDHWIAYGTYDNHLRPMYWNTDASRNDFHYVDQWGPEYEADKAIEYISNPNNSFREGNKPFALVVSMNPPHTGYNLVPQKYKDIYKNTDVESLCKAPSIPPKDTPMGNYYRKNILDYYACMSGVDEQVGRIVQQLKDQGLFENTIIVFTSDHGNCLGEHNKESKNNFYEESLRIPMIISFPNKIHARRDSSLMISFADLYPSLLSLMGFKKDIPEQVQTFDLSTFILSDKKKASVVQPYYFIQPGNPSSGYRGLRTGRYTFAIHTTNGKPDEWILFDREQDPFELQNCAPSNPGLIKDFTKQLKKWLIKTNDPFAAYL